MSEPGHERELIDRAIAGDRRALEQLLLTQSIRLSRRVSRRLPASQRGLIDAEDVLHETFIQAIRDIRTCQASTLDGFSAWMTTIADHRLQDMLKGLKRRKRGGGRQQQRIQQDQSSSWLGLMELVAGSAHTPSQSAARREAVRAIQVAVAALPDDQREAVRQRYLEGKTIHETAAAMGRTHAAVNGLVRRAKQALRDSLQQSSLWLRK